MMDHTSGLTLTSPEGARFHFDAGALCLELLTTGGPGPFVRYESLHEPEDLVRWLAVSRLRLAPGQVSVDDAGLATMRTLRDALWRTARAHAHAHNGAKQVDGVDRDYGEHGAGDPARPEDLETINRAAAAPPLVPQIGADGGRTLLLPAGAGQVASTIARDAVELFTGPLAARVRECSADNCHLVFVDASRPGRRRWCSMERCGNRNKVRALRARGGHPQ